MSTLRTYLFPWAAPKVTAERLRAEQLEAARQELLHHASRREYYTAMERMLEERIVRLTPPTPGASPPREDSSVQEEAQTSRPMPSPAGLAHRARAQNRVYGIGGESNTYSAQNSTYGIAYGIAGGLGL